MGIVGLSTDFCPAERSFLRKTWVFGSDISCAKPSSNTREFSSSRLTLQKAQLGLPLAQPSPPGTVRANVRLTSNVRRAVCGTAFRLWFAWGADWLSNATSPQVERSPPPRSPVPNARKPILRFAELPSPSGTVRASVQPTSNVHRAEAERQLARAEQPCPQRDKADSWRRRTPKPIGDSAGERLAHFQCPQAQAERRLAGAGQPCPQRDKADPSTHEHPTTTHHLHPFHPNVRQHPQLSPCTSTKEVVCFPVEAQGEHTDAGSEH